MFGLLLTLILAMITCAPQRDDRARRLPAVARGAPKLAPLTPIAVGFPSVPRAPWLSVVGGSHVSVPDLIESHTVLFAPRRADHERRHPVDGATTPLVSGRFIAGPAWARRCAPPRTPDAPMGISVDTTIASRSCSVASWPARPAWPTRCTRRTSGSTPASQVGPIAFTAAAHGRHRQPQGRGARPPDHRAHPTDLRQPQALLGRLPDRVRVPRAHSSCAVGAARRADAGRAG